MKERLTPEKRSQSSNSGDPMIADMEARGVHIQKMPSASQYPSLNLSDIVSKDRARTALVQKQVADFGEMCARFLSGSVVTDSFASHMERRMWRHEMDAKYGRSFHDILERNQLKLNNLAGIYSYMEFVVSGLDGADIQTEKANQIRALSRALPDLSGYESATLDERTAIARTYVHLCEEYLRLLGNVIRRR